MFDMLLVKGVQKLHVLVLRVALASLEWEENRIHRKYQRFTNRKSQRLIPRNRKLVAAINYVENSLDAFTKEDV